MLVVAKPAPPALAQARVEHRLPGVAEGRMAEVVAEPDRLGEVLVQPERSRHAARDPAGLERVGEARAVVVALGRDEDLGLVLQAPEGLRVDNPVAIALERRTMVRLWFRLLADGRIRAGGERREKLLQPLDPLPERGSGELGHGRSIVSVAGARFEACGTDVELVEEEAARKIRLTPGVESGVRHVVRNRVPLLPRPGHGALELVHRGLPLLRRRRAPVPALGSLELLAERLRCGGLPAASRNQDRRRRG